MARLSKDKFIERIKDIKLLALDVDGVLTDDSIYFGPDGFELKRFNISDGFFMALAMRSGLELAIVSGRYSPATDTRMRDLGISHVLQGKKDKCQMIEPLLSELNLKYNEIAFAGNELLDLKLASKAGLSIAVADAVDELKEMVDFVTEKNGGNGAVREIISYYFQANNIDPKSLLV